MKGKPSYGAGKTSARASDRSPLRKATVARDERAWKYREAVGTKGIKRPRTRH